jgi:hypothetical protein
MTAMAYDQARHVVLMYGGRDTIGGTVPCGEFAQWLCSADTWTWDGNDWARLHPLKAPPPFVPTVAYDPTDATVLLYNTNGNVPETWSWDGAAWSLKASGSSNPQPSRGTPVLAFDPASQHVVMFGGFTPGGGNVNTMWSWIGNAWRNLGTDAPFPKLGAAAAPELGRAALLGYQSPEVLPPAPPITNVAPAQTWEWDGRAWTQLHPLHEPTAIASGLFTDPKSHKILLLGTNPRTNAIEIWAWNNSDWSQLA